MMPNGQALRHDTGPSHASVEKAADKHDRTSSPVQSKSKGITWHTPHTYQETLTQHTCTRNGRRLGDDRGNMKFITENTEHHLASFTIYPPTTRQGLRL